MTTIHREIGRKGLVPMPPVKRWQSVPHAGRTLAEEYGHSDRNVSFRSALSGELSGTSRPAVFLRAFETKSLRQPMQNSALFAVRDLPQGASHPVLDATRREVRKN